MAENANATAATVVAPTYLELISKDEKAVKKEGLSIVAQESGLEVTRAIFAVKSEIAKTSQLLTTSQRQVPYSVNTEFNLAKKLSELQTKLNFFQEIKAVRFRDAQI